jgi:hypothetical protein
MTRLVRSRRRATARALPRITRMHTDCQGF